MAVSYNNLWKLLIDKRMNKSELAKAIGVSSSTMAKLAKEEHDAMQVLERICAELDCNIWDIMELKELDQVRRKMRDKSLRKS